MGVVCSKGRLCSVECDTRVRGWVVLGATGIDVWRRGWTFSHSDIRSEGQLYTCSHRASVHLARTSTTASNIKPKGQRAPLEAPSALVTCIWVRIQHRPLWSKSKRENITMHRLRRRLLHDLCGESPHSYVVVGETLALPRPTDHPGAGRTKPNAMCMTLNKTYSIYLKKKTWF